MRWILSEVISILQKEEGKIRHDIVNCLIFLIGKNYRKAMNCILLLQELYNFTICKEQKM